MYINELLKKLRSTTAFPAQGDDVDADGDTGKQSLDLEKTTNGPYDNMHVNVELQDDPAAMADNQVKSENYVSTIEPDTVTTFPGSFNPSSH